MVAGRLEREQRFWDAETPTWERAVGELGRIPEPNTRLALEIVQPGRGRRILDVACGAGITAIQMARLGAEVVAVDISPASIELGKRLAQESGVRVEFRVGDIETLDRGGFDAIFGRYALHHLDLERAAPVLAGALNPGGVASFVENFGFNPLLNVARETLPGRFGIPKYGSDDEHPLRQHDLDVVAASFGSVALTVAEYRFLLFADRQVLHGRLPRLVPWLRSGDRALHRVLPRWSFTQILVAGRDPDRHMSPAALFPVEADPEAHRRP